MIGSRTSWRLYMEKYVYGLHHVTFYKMLASGRILIPLKASLFRRPPKSIIKQSSPFPTLYRLVNNL